MSLKQFHLFFISVCVVMSLGVGTWCYFYAQRNSDSTIGYYGYGFIALALMLVGYEIWFSKKISARVSDGEGR